MYHLAVSSMGDPLEGDHDLPKVLAGDPITSNDNIGAFQREGTPVSSKPTLPLSTPVKQSSSTYVPFSTFSRVRHRTINTMGKEMRDHFVGPMPPKDFLSEFLPDSKIPGYEAVEFVNPSPFQQTVNAETELDAYKPFVSRAFVVFICI